METDQCSVICIVGVEVTRPGGINRLFSVNNLTIAHPRDAGRFYCVVGPTGCGKSTLLKLLAGLETPSRGKIEHVQADALIAYLPQKPVIFPHLNARNNAEYFASTARYSRQATKIRQRVGELGSLLRLNWPELNKTSPENWSGGEAQRVCLIRVLSLEPDLLLMDEPCSGLDVLVRRQLLQILRAEAVTRKMTVLYVTHHGDEVLWTADHLICFTGTNSHPPFEVRDISLATAFISPPTPDVALQLSPTANLVQADSSGAFEIHAPMGQSRETVVEDIVSRITMSAQYEIVDTKAGNRIVQQLRASDSPDLTDDTTRIWPPRMK